MLVMRNFGYLGLHTVVDKKSSLARERLIDFTGELQLRLAEKEAEEKHAEEKPSTKDPYTTRLPQWHSKFVSEAVADGGRIEETKVERDVKNPKMNSFAQELSPLPLQLSPSAPRGMNVAPGNKGFMQRGRLHGDDMEPFYHLSFCNELLFHPRLLHNCPKGNIAIKVELREMEFQPDFNGYFAHLPTVGPSIHNPRRGPFLVQSAFTSCSPRGGDHHFIDEFKVKLPLNLDVSQKVGRVRVLSLFFTVFNVHLDSKKSWKRAKKYLSSKPGESSDSDEPEASSMERLEQIASGFLPITGQSCLIENGMHDVRVVYKAHIPPRELCDRGLVDPDTLVLIERTDTTESQGGSMLDESYADDKSVSTDKGSTSERPNETTGRNDEKSVASLSDLASIDDSSRGGKTRATPNTEPISLSVRPCVCRSFCLGSSTDSCCLL